MSQVVGSNSSYKLITNTRGFTPSFVNYKKGCTRLAAASDKVYQLLAQGRWFSPGTSASSTTKTGRLGIAEILLKVALNTKIQIQIYNSKCFEGAVIVVIVWQLDLLLAVQSVPFTTKFVSLNPAHVKVYLIQLIMFVSGLRQVNGFPWVLWFPPPIKLTALI